MVYSHHMKPKPPAGFREVEHTADWELQVWAQDLPGLLREAAAGMYALTGARLEAGERVVRQLEFPAGDPESLLVAFLSELLYFGEVQGLGFDDFEITLEGERVRIQMRGAPVASQSRHIKAVTWHNLKVDQGPQGLEASLVLDV